MHIKSIVAGAAIALAATVGSAYAADQFATLDGSAQEILACDPSIYSVLIRRLQSVIT